MNDKTTCAALVKDGIKFIQKRSNPIESFAQKRVNKFSISPFFNQNQLLIDYLFSWNI